MTNDPRQRSPKKSMDALIAEAGARPTPPKEHLAQIRAATKEEWRKLYAVKSNSADKQSEPAATEIPATAIETQSEHGGDTPLPFEVPERRPSAPRIRNSWLIAAGLLALVGVSWWWLGTGTHSNGLDAPTPSIAVASVTRVVGQVEHLANEEATSQALRGGLQLEVGDTVETSRSDNTIASLRLASGHTLRIAQGSRLRFLAVDQVELLEGKIYIASDPLAQGPGSSVTVHTAIGSVRDIGTQFEVALLKTETKELQLRARVREGEIALHMSGAETGDGESASAPAGEELLGHSTGRISRRQVAVFGEEWQWVLAGATPFPMDGRSGADLLNWLASETGREVVYQDANAASAANSSLDAGQSKAVEPAKALDVLLTLDLTARYEGGRILVAFR